MIPRRRLDSATDAEILLQKSRGALGSESSVSKRVFSQIQQRISVPKPLFDAREALKPSQQAHTAVWQRIMESLVPVSPSAWQGIQSAFAPFSTLRDVVWDRITPRLQPAPSGISRPIKWVAAMAIVLLGVRASPLLFLAPYTIANSPVTLIPTRGDVEVLVGSLWQPIKQEMAVTQQTSLQTQDSEATIILHDDAVIRLAPHTSIALYDLSDRPEHSTEEASVALLKGKIWVLGLIPSYVTGITVLTADGRVVLHEGSASIQSENGVTVSVWDRHATVARRVQQKSLYSGQSISLSRAGDMVVEHADVDEYQSDWVAGNLAKDAAHRQEIAQLQQERRAASAGILPGTTLYPVKRLAETVDVLLTFDEETKIQKRIQQANTRLNEAAALIAQGQQPTEPLREYKQTIIAVATGSGSNPVVQNLLEKEVLESNVTSLAAALPGDPAYTLKEAVHDTIASLPATVSKPDVTDESVFDQLALLKRQVAQGETEAARDQLKQLTERVSTGTGAIAGESDEFKADLQLLTERVGTGQLAATESGSLPAMFQRPEREAVLPRHPSRSWMALPMTTQQVTAKAQEIRGRIFVFGTKKAQLSELRDQLRVLEQNPDKGRILRELAKVLPRNGLQQQVLIAIRNLNKAVVDQMTASGGILEDTSEVQDQEDK